MKKIITLSMLVLLVLCGSAFAGGSASSRMAQVVEQPASGDVDGGAIGSTGGTDGGVVAP